MSEYGSEGSYQASSFTKETAFYGHIDNILHISATNGKKQILDLLYGKKTASPNLNIEHSNPDDFFQLFNFHTQNSPTKNSSREKTLRRWNHRRLRQLLNLGCFCSVDGSIKRKIHLTSIYTPGSTNIAGWKIHHECRCISYWKRWISSLLC